MISNHTYITLKFRKIASSIFAIFFFSFGLVLLNTCQKSNINPDLSKGFIKYYGGAGGDIANEVQITSDGGYIIVGTSGSFSNGNSDIYVVKTDKSGNTIWAKNYGGFGADSGKSIKETPDGNYIVAGGLVVSVAGTSKILNQIYLLKINQSGDTIWTRKFGYLQNETIAYDIKIAPDGGYLVGASVYYTNAVNGFTRKLYYLKVNEFGNLAQSLNPLGTEGLASYISSVLPGAIEGEVDFLATSGLINEVSAGSAESKVYSPIVGKLNKDGNLSQTLDKLSPNVNIPQALFTGQMKRTPDGGYIVCGTGINSETGAFEAFLVKLNSNKDKEGDYIGYSNGFNAVGNSVDITSDGGYIITGTIESTNNSGFEIMLIKVDSEGNQQWIKTFGGAADDVGTSVLQTKDGGYIISGMMSLQSKQPSNIVMCLIKTDANGKITN
ncbi:MAG: hypothetical protein SFY32_12125 [Bacteroidota bacterium]|nr:hypothetical protein [Bacteroidota bacterium]